eukprot:s4171_g1.t1
MARRGLSVDHTTAQIVSGSLAPRGLLLPLSEKVIRMAIASSSTYLVLTLVSLLEHWRVPMSDECATDVICHGLDVLQSGQPNDEQVDIAGLLIQLLQSILLTEVVEKRAMPTSDQESRISAKDSAGETMQALPFFSMNPVSIIFT